MTQATNILWSPNKEAVKHSHLTRFQSAINKKYALDIADYDALYNWSISQPETFWDAIWDYCDIQAETKDNTVLVNPQDMLGAKFFPKAKINFAENLLTKNDHSDAIVFRGEDVIEKRLSWAELTNQVSCFQQYLQHIDLQTGERVAALLPNMPETVVAMLATAASGGVWSSCSPEFGIQGILDRFGQIKPSVLLVTDGYFYNGKVIDISDKVSQLMQKLPSLRAVVCIPYINLVRQIADTESWQDILNRYQPDKLEFVQLPFNHPLYIMFSSGTTGKPKCIVHGAGGTLLQHMKEHKLHCDIKPSDRVFYFTTCSWMMWNWLVSTLASKATLMLYDGSPFYPSPDVLFDYVQDEKITFFGTSAKYIDALRKAKRKPRQTHDLTSLKMITSTGSPLMPASFDYVYEHVKRDVCLASISGGTDILSCFVLGNPTTPVYRGEIQACGLGMAVEVWDQQGNAVMGKKGELVCTKPFPSMPIGFWNDADNSRYKAAYFEQYSNIWTHGDYAEITPNGGFIIHGRSDATLNPGGVRIGTAEIYRHVETHPDVLEAIAVGQEFENDVRVILFVVLTDRKEMDEVLIKDLKARVWEGASPRHVPAKIIQVGEIPRTANGKIVEMAVREVVHGREVNNIESIANPEALEQFKDLADLRT